MTMRPIDIARRLKISTTMLRHYEEFGIIPPVMRSQNGYRIYTGEHMAYFICIREMMQGFTLSEIAKMLKSVMENKHDEALWTANKAQSVLQNDKSICEQIRLRFLQKKKTAVPEEFTIDTVSRLTGINPSTIRYWDKVGLISASRCAANNYRTFTQTHIDEILIIQALKLNMRARGEKYAVEQVRREMHNLSFTDTGKISSIIAGIEKHLTALNRAQILSIYALYRLCTQIEEGRFDF